MIAYKGFNKRDDGTLWCNDFQYEPGKVYKHKGEIRICEKGFHACHELHQVWQFYPNNGDNVFYEVECGGEIIESEDGDGKFVCSEIRLVMEIDMSDMAKFEYAWDFHEGFSLVELDNKWNFIDTEGKLLSNQWFEYAWDFHEGFARVKLNGKYNFIDTECKLLSEQWYNYACSLSEGFALVVLDGKWNFIDTSGNLLSEQWYDDVYSFYEGFARVYLNGKFNFIDTKGNLLSEQWYNDAWSFREGFAPVKLNGKWHKIDTEGKIVE